MENKKRLILSAVQDLVSAFLFYDRKEDEELGDGDIQNALKNGDITFPQIHMEFQKELGRQLKEL